MDVAGSRLAGALLATITSVLIIIGTGVNAAADTIDPTSIPMTVVTSSGEPVVGVDLTATDETQPNADPRGCGQNDTTLTDAAGHCTFYRMAPGHLYAIWLQGINLSGSGDARPPMQYQPIVLHVTGRQGYIPGAHGTPFGEISGIALTSAGERIPATGVCAVAGSFEAGVNCTQTDQQGNYSVQGCCDVRVIGHLAGSSEPYVNGSVLHVATGSSATLVVVVAGTVTPPAPTTSTVAPTARSKAVSATGRLAQTGQGIDWIITLTLGLLLIGAGLLLFVAGQLGAKRIDSR